MSQSNSSKTDKELMWEKLSTVTPVLLPWQRQLLGRSMRNGELTIIAAARRSGKSMITNKIWNMLSESNEARAIRIAQESQIKFVTMVDDVSKHNTDEYG